MTTRPRSWLPAYTVTRRAFLRATAAGAGAAALIACGGGSSTTTFKFADSASSRQPGTVWRTENDFKLADETKEAVTGGIYRGSITADMTGNYDTIAQMDSQVPFAQHVYEQLLARNRRPGVDPATKDGQSPVPALAEAWETSEDGLTITFTLRQGVKWQNIAPVNARLMDMDDWRTSQERHLKIGIYRSFIGDVLDHTEFPDAKHMVWKLKFPYAPLTERMGGGHEFAYEIEPKELNADPRLAESVGIGTGFKYLDRYDRSITMEYRKNPDYWGGAPFIDRWHFPIIPEYANRYAQFVKGSITTFAPTSTDVLQLAKDVPGAVIVADPPENDRGSRYLFGIVSPDKQPTNDPRVRVAIRRSIDFKTIGEFLSNKAAFEAAGIPIDVRPMTHLPQNPAYWLNPENNELGALSDNFLYNVAEAKKLMSAAGWATKPAPITVPVQLSSGTVPDQDRLIMDSFQKSGTFDVNVLAVTTANEQNKYRVDRDFDGIVWSGGSGVDPDYIMGRDWSRTYTFGDRQAYWNPKTEELFQAQRKEIDFDKRMAVLKDVQRWAAEWMMVVPAQHIFTRISFRWPWLHNAQWGESATLGKDNWGAHYQWLDAAMPNRDKGAS